jgi:phage tail-like protein
MDIPTAHLLLRDRRHWLGHTRGLRVDADGMLTLLPLPGPADGGVVDVASTYPCVREVSGLACGPCEALFVADTMHDRILFDDRACRTSGNLPGAGAPGLFAAPRGLALDKRALWIADSGHGRIVGLARPSLESRLALNTGGAPGSLAIDGAGRYLFVDASRPALRRLHADGSHDAAFDGAVAGVLAAFGQTPSGGDARPHQLAVGDDDRVWLSDTGFDQVWIFSGAGALDHSLSGPPGWMPGAIALQGTRAYVANAADGSIGVFESRVWLGNLPQWRGPVSALALCPNGDLMIKSALDAQVSHFVADAAVLDQGQLLAGPFDAGEDRSWERAWIEGAPSDGPVRDDSVRLQVAFQAHAAPAPAAGAWQWVPAGDALLSTMAAAADARFVWLRLHLRCARPNVSPRVAQVRCASATEQWLDYLPQTYRLADGPDGFLERWLKLLRGEYGRIDELIDDLPQTNDPRFAAASQLPWLASWLALDLPRIASDDERRELLERAMQDHARRGTPDSIADMVELHTGIRPAIVEAFGERCIWALDAGCRLDFDTRLAASDPLGMVVPDEATPAANGGCAQDGANDTGGGAIGRIVVGATGPLLPQQLGAPLFAESAWRFCVIVDAYRAAAPGVLDELRRIVEREKPAHTDWRLQLVAPETRVGWQSRVGIDTIVGGQPPRHWPDPATLGHDTELAPAEPGRIGDQTLDGSFTLH